MSWSGVLLEEEWSGWQSRTQCIPPRKKAGLCPCFAWKCRAITVPRKRKQSAHRETTASAGVRLARGDRECGRTRHTTTGVSTRRPRMIPRSDCLPFGFFQGRLVVRSARPGGSRHYKSGSDWIAQPLRPHVRSPPGRVARRKGAVRDEKVLRFPQPDRARRRSRSRLRESMWARPDGKSAPAKQEGEASG